MNETDTGNLPKWCGALAAYSKAYKILAKLAKNAPHWRELPSSNRRHPRSDSFLVCTDDMEAIIKALNKGDEETIKGYNLQYLHLV